MTQENQAHGADQKPYLPARQNHINQPLQDQRREQRQKATDRDAKETGSMPAKEWTDLPGQPTNFRRNPRDHAGPRSLQERKTAPAKESADYLDGETGLHTSLDLFAIPTMGNDSSAIGRNGSVDNRSARSEFNRNPTGKLNRGPTASPASRDPVAHATLSWNVIRRRPSTGILGYVHEMQSSRVLSYQFRLYSERVGAMEAFTV